jgi:hypothetical protein
MHSSIAGDDKMNSESRDASEEVFVFRPLRCLKRSASSKGSAAWNVASHTLDAE